MYTKVRQAFYQRKQALPKEHILLTEEKHFLEEDKHFTRRRHFSVAEEDFLFYKRKCRGNGPLHILLLLSRHIETNPGPQTDMCFTSFHWNLNSICDRGGFKVLMQRNFRTSFFHFKRNFNLC